MIHLEELVSNGWKRDLQGLEKTGSALAEQGSSAAFKRLHKAMQWSGT